MDLFAVGRASLTTQCSGQGFDGRCIASLGYTQVENAVMTPIVLDGSKLFWLIIVAFSCFTVGWVATFYALRNKTDHLRSLLMDGNLIRLLTVMFVVFATTVLAVMGAMTEAVSAIFAGIVGYVLGSMGKEQSNRTSANSGGNGDQSAQPGVGE